MASDTSQQKRQADSSSPESKRCRKCDTPVKSIKYTRSNILELNESIKFEVPLALKLDSNLKTETLEVQVHEFLVTLTSVTKPPEADWVGVEITMKVQTQKYDVKNLHFEAGVYSYVGERRNHETKYLSVKGQADPVSFMSFRVKPGYEWMIWVKFIFPKKVISNSETSYLNTLKLQVKPSDLSTQLYESRNTTGDTTLKTKTESHGR